MGDVISGLSKEEIGNHNEEADDRREGEKDDLGDVLILLWDWLVLIVELSYNYNSLFDNILLLF